MLKFYVSSGDLQVTTESDVPKNAALAAFFKIKDIQPIKRLGRITVVSEHGFDSDKEDDTYYITSDLLDETNQIEDFASTEWTE